MDCFNLVSELVEHFRKIMGPMYQPNLELSVSLGPGKKPEFVLHLTCINYLPSDGSIGNYLRVDSVDVDPCSTRCSEMLSIAFHNALPVNKVKRER